MLYLRMLFPCLQSSPGLLYVQTHSPRRFFCVFPPGSHHTIRNKCTTDHHEICSALLFREPSFTVENDPGLAAPAHIVVQVPSCCTRLCMDKR
jgi:hypothetical protein